MIDIKDEPSGKFWFALGEAEVGDRIIYHIGPHCGGTHRTDAWAAHERGLVTLVQSRGEPGMFIYIAQKLDPKRENK